MPPSSCCENNWQGRCCSGRKLRLWTALAAVVMILIGYRFNSNTDYYLCINIEPEQIVQLVLSMTNLSVPSCIKMMNETIDNTTCTLRSSLYWKIKNFEQTLKSVPDSADKRLPTTFIGTDTGIQYSEFWQGHRLPVIAVGPIGRLGNLMGEYATLFALRELFNASAVLTEQHRRTLINDFPKLSLPRLSINETESWVKLGEEQQFSPYYSSLQLAALGLMGPRRFLSTGYPFEVQLFNEHAHKIHKEFRFSEQIIKKAQAFLSSAKLSLTSEVVSQEAFTFVGVHIRLGDYPNFMKTCYGVILDYKSYIKRAIQYYKDRYNNTVFIVASDDIQEAEKLVRATGAENIFVANGTRTPAEDMCLLSQCNHSIITVGTYGFWTGYLNPGTTVYANVVKPKREYIISQPFFEAARLDNFIPLPLSLK